MSLLVFLNFPFPLEMMVLVEDCLCFLKKKTHTLCPITKMDVATNRINIMELIFPSFVKPSAVVKNSDSLVSVLLEEWHLFYCFMPSYIMIQLQCMPSWMICPVKLRVTAKLLTWQHRPVNKLFCFFLCFPQGVSVPVFSKLATFILVLEWRKKKELNISTDTAGTDNKYFNTNYYNHYSDICTGLVFLVITPHEQRSWFPSAIHHVCNKLTWFYNGMKWYKKQTCLTATQLRRHYKCYSISL